MDIQVGQNVTLYMKKSEAKRAKREPVEGKVIGISGHYVVIQHKYYKECYTMHDFREALSPIGGA